VLVLRPAILDHDILALDVAGFANALPECGQIACTISKRRAAEKSDHRHRRLLRARRERPRGCSAAEQRYELAASHAEHGDFPPVVWRRRHRAWRSVYRMFSLPQSSRQVLGSSLNRSESRRGGAKPPALPKR
jgi:hypothetical protein